MYTIYQNLMNAFICFYISIFRSNMSISANCIFDQINQISNTWNYMSVRRRLMTSSNPQCVRNNSSKYPCVVCHLRVCSNPL